MIYTKTMNELINVLQTFMKDISHEVVDNYQEHELHGNSPRDWEKNKATCSTCFKNYQHHNEFLMPSAQRHSFEIRMAEINLGGNPEF